MCAKHLSNPTQKSNERILQTDFSEKEFLQNKVDELEKSKEFEAVVNKSMAQYAGEYHNKAQWGFKEDIKNFFRQSGCYTDIYDGNFCIEKQFELFTKSFKEGTISTTYLALMEGIEFTRKINGVNYSNNIIDFGHFQVKKYSKEELDSFTNNRIRSTFYPYTIINTELLSQYWFTVVNCEDPMKRIVATKLDIDISGHIKREYSSFPPVIELLLYEIVLFEWEESPPNKHDEWFFPFNIPLVLQIKNNPIIRPTSLPYFSPNLVPILDNNGYEIGEEPIIWIEMDEKISSKFITFVKRIHELLSVIDKANKEDKGKYNFIELALGYFLKAFISEPNLEQVIWHIVVLEALLGKEYKIRASIETSIRKLFGEKEKEKFNELYKIRCEYVHGNEMEEDKIFLTHLREARILARKTINWFLKLLEIVLPKYSLNRDEIRALINEDQKSFKKLTDLIELLPKNFPVLE
jgi:hypothetical protein